MKLSWWPRFSQAAGVLAGIAMGVQAHGHFTFWYNDVARKYGPDVAERFWNQYQPAIYIGAAVTGVATFAALLAIKPIVTALLRRLPPGASPSDKP